MQHLPAARPVRAALLCSAAFALSACSMWGGKTSSPAMASLPDADIAYRLAGQGKLPVVFQSGLGDNKEVWADVLPAVEQQHQVLTYDRPGYGASPKTSAPRDPCTIAAQQHQLLAKTGLKPPYILVGNGIGGLYQYVYAKMYPQDVAGLVLLDPVHPERWRRLQSDAPTWAMALKARQALILNATKSAEFEAQTQCLLGIDSKTAVRAPAMLLVRGKFSIEESGPYETVVREQEKDWQRLIGAPAIERVTGAGPAIQKDNPVIVNEAIRMVAKAR